MFPQKNDDIADGATAKNLTVAKRGYSIWSLLVIMTLLAVWLAVPKPTWKFGPIIHSLLYGLHQVAIWALVGALIWILSGKQRMVLIIAVSSILLIWGPLFVMVLEYCITMNEAIPMTRFVMEPLGLYEAYLKVHTFMIEAFGYGPI